MTNDKGLSEKNVPNNKNQINTRQAEIHSNNKFLHNPEWNIT